MADQTPPLTWLKAFDAAARHLSFTRAAEELGLTQSAISQHVRALEAQLGQALFHRAHRQLHLTDAGRLLAPDVAAGLALLSQAARRFRQVPEIRTLRIATSASVAQHLLAPRIAGFQSLCPNLVVEISTTVWPDDFIKSAADIEIRFGRAEMVGQGAELLHPSRLHAVATPEMACKYAAGETLPLIQAKGLSTKWSDLVNGAQPDLYVDTHGMAVNLACAGAGVALTHCLISRPSILTGALVPVSLPEISAKEGYFMAPKTAHSLPEIARFAEWFRGVIAALWTEGSHGSA